MRATAERGLSIIEATIVLSLMALLSAVLGPSINAYVESARRVRAGADVRALGGAIRDFMEDNGENQFLVDANTAITTPATAPSRVDANRVNLLISDGDVPARASAISGETFWSQPLDSDLVDTFANHLGDNTPAELTANRYRMPTDIRVATPASGTAQIDFVRTSHSGFNAPYAWRGGYLREPVGPDPWGNRYAANVAFLDTTHEADFTAGIITASGSGGPSGFANYPKVDVIVISAGPDEEIDTKSAVDGAVPGDDDFIFVVSSDVRN